jgi:hypothetical protein
VNDTLIALPAIALVSAGVLVDLVGFTTMFGAMVAVAVTAVLSAGRLPSDEARNREADSH